MRLTTLLYTSILLTSFLHVEVKAQSSVDSFHLFGNVNVDSGRILLRPFADSSWYPGNVKVLEGRIQHGSFYFSGPITYPYAFMTQILNDSGKLVYVSDMFFVDKGFQNIKLRAGKGREPEINNVTTSERNEKFKKATQELRSKLSDYYRREASLKDEFNNTVPDTTLASLARELKTLLNKRDSILWKYAKQNPHSYVVLWELVSLSHSVYKPVYDSIYNALSVDLKNTATGRGLYNQLQSSSRVNAGNIFPALILRDLDNKKTILSIPDKKYTLIDFWFSDCFPCIGQLDKLKELYHNYNKNLFDIISISVDDSLRINNLKKVIAKYALSWKQYLDLNGKESMPLGIYSFPTNFLLDREGKVLEANIDLSELQLILEK